MELKTLEAGDPMNGDMRKPAIGPRVVDKGGMKTPKRLAQL